MIIDIITELNHFVFFFSEMVKNFRWNFLCCVQKKKFFCIFYNKLNYLLTIVFNFFTLNQRCGSTVEYFLLPLPAPYKVSRLRVASSSSFFKALPLGKPQKFNRFQLPLPCTMFYEKCFRFRLFKKSNALSYFRFQLLSLKCFRFHKNLTTSASTSLL